MSMDMSGSYTHSELSDYPISEYFSPSFLEELQTTPYSDYVNPMNLYTVRPETPEKNLLTKVRLCDTVLKYISHVLMEDDDFEDDQAPSFNDSKLDATKRSFQEIIVGDKRHSQNYDDLPEIETYMRNTKFFATDESAIHETLGKIVSFYGKQRELASNTCNGSFTQRKAYKREAISTRNLLLKCTEYVAITDHEIANKLMNQIRLRSHANGNGTQRMAHFFANGLQLRLDGGYNLQEASLTAMSMSSPDLLKAFKLYFTEFPFVETSYFFANQMILNSIDKRTNTLHIIHFGIMHGLQWPPLIQQLSDISDGCPKLRITGIDFPQSGFRSDARVKETGRKLTSYCKKFNIPFEYNSFSKRWDTVKLEDLKIKKDEVVVVNTMYHSMYLLDDSLMEHSPRDTALNLIKNINPKLFIHVIVNGTYNSPFFLSRFREALFYFSTWFDMFDEILTRDSPERKVFEREVWGREIMNIIAIEGLKRVERPETYKQWQKRTTRAGFKPVPLNRKIVSDIQARVESRYHKDFFVEEADNWLLDGWRGRALFALSCWKPDD